MDINKMLDLRQRVNAVAKNPNVDANVLGEAYAIILESGLESPHTLLADLNERLADDFIMLNDPLLDRLQRDVLTVPVFPAPSLSSPLAKMLAERRSLIQKSGRMGWRNVIKLRPLPFVNLGLPGPQQVSQGFRGGHFLPPITYDDYKAGRHFPVCAEIRLYKKFVDAGPMAVLTGLLAILFGNDAEQVVKQMEDAESIDLMFTATAMVQRKGLSKIETNKFEGAGMSYVSSDPARLPTNPLLSEAAIAEAQAIQERLAKVLEQGGPTGGGRAIGGAEIQIPGYRGSTSVLRSRSGIGDPLKPAQKVPHATTPSSPRTLSPCFICQADEHRTAVRNGQGRSRAHDAEVKILEEVQKNLPPNAIGTVYIASSLPVCPSCTTVIYEFLGKNPGVKVVVFAPAAPVTTITGVQPIPDPSTSRPPKVPPKPQTGSRLFNEGHIHAGAAADDSDIWKF